MKKVAIIMGSDSDLPVVEKTAFMLDELKIPYEMHVYSAHRTPEQVRSFALSAKDNGFGVIIAAAGMSAALGGSLAASTTLPVIGIPIGGKLSGMDSLLSTVMMPSGIPVAAVAVDGAKNAAILAAEILAVYDDDIAERLAAMRERDRAAVLSKDEKISSEYSKA
ncbi:MAG: 5-(carboxyamino)imidazole ribonucleotide mutase [Firmicutes bacterium]|nr:5-(carboxyamino)imidazole ribonucleotide mutase [Bacillota bacterium]MCD7831192.1 5-(carboxyamino)imidazole ribonucleotide mutase [Bacillota bacterium]MCD8311531.1 5-(carboxyamino)imidazole ribonucleotide mutase [Bacillota bacterium]